MFFSQKRSCGCQTSSSTKPRRWEGTLRASYLLPQSGSSWLEFFVKVTNFDQNFFIGDQFYIVWPQDLSRRHCSLCRQKELWSRLPLRLLQGALFLDYITSTSLLTIAPKYPFDTHVCEAIIHSFAYTTNNYNLKVLKNGNLKDQTVTNISSPQFDGELNTRSHLIKPGMFSLDSIEYDDNFNMQEYNNIQPGLKIRIKLTRWRTLPKCKCPTLLLSGSGPVSWWRTCCRPCWWCSAPTPRSTSPSSPSTREATSPSSGSSKMFLSCTHNHAIMFPSILNVFLLNDGIRRNIPKLGYPTLLDIWIFGCFLATFLIRFLYSFIVVSSPFSHTSPSIQLPVRAGVQLLGHRQGVHREGDREKVLHHLRRALRHLHRRLHRPRSCECLYLSQTNWARHVSVWINAEKQGNILIYQGNQGSLSIWGLGWVLTSSGGMMWALCREEWDKDYCCFISPTLFSRLPFPLTCTHIHVVFKLCYKSFIQYLTFLRPELTPLCTFASHLTYI